jgi:hypothetical protein
MKWEDRTLLGFDIDSDQIQQSKVLAFANARAGRFVRRGLPAPDGARLRRAALSQSVHAITGILSVGLQAQCTPQLYLHQQVTGEPDCTVKLLASSFWFGAAFVRILLATTGIALNHAHDS